MRRVLARETGAALMIFHDLLVLDPDRPNFLSPFLPDSPELTPWAVSSWSLGSKEFQVFWPEPACATFWEFDQFLNLWNDSLPSIGSSREVEQDWQLERAAFAW